MKNKNDAKIFTINPLAVDVKMLKKAISYLENNKGFEHHPVKEIGENKYAIHVNKYAIYAKYATLSKFYQFHRYCGV